MAVKRLCLIDNRVNYTPRLPLMKHQLAAIVACENKPPMPTPEDVFGYLLDMGTGKSSVVLAEWGEMATNGGPQDLLVIAPAGSYRNWFVDKSREQPSELNKHVDPAFLERLVWASWRSGGGKEATERLRLMLASTGRPRALFMNVEALSSVDRAKDLCDEFVERGAMVVVDESTTIKSHRSARTKYVMALGEKALAKRILSGLWTPRSPMDLFSQCAFLDWRILGHRNYFAFQRKYAVTVRQSFGGRKFDQIVGYQNLEELQARVAKYSYRVLKKDCLDLAPKTYDSRVVELTAEQLRMTKEIKLFGHAKINTEDGVERFVTTDMVIKQIMRLHQINCGYVMDDADRVLHEVPERRTEALLAVLGEHQGKAIIWCPWRAPLDKIVRVLSKEYGPQAVAQFHGGNRATRDEEEARFLGDPECLYMVATQGAGMRGNTWVVADLAVYYANNYDLEQRDQSEDRFHRKGQTRRVTVMDLIAPGTVDEKIVKSLRMKIDMATMINQEGYREWLV